MLEYHAPRLEPQDPNPSVNIDGYTHFALQVNKLAACYQRLVEAGIRVSTTPNLSSTVPHLDDTKTGWGCTYCRGYFGNVFEIMEIHGSAR